MRIFRNYLKENINPYSQRYDIEGLDVVCYKKLEQTYNPSNTQQIVQINEVVKIHGIYPYDNLTYYVFLKNCINGLNNTYYFTDDNNFGDYFGSGRTHH